MKKHHILILVFCTVAIGLVIYSMVETQSDIAYIHALKEEREKKDQLMTTSGYPFEKKNNLFKGLQYFNPDPAYQVTAQLEPILIKKIITLQATTGEKKDYREYAYANFVLHGVQNRLLILELNEASSQRLFFLAFSDATSSLETYGGGRYLDIDITEKSKFVVLDFNQAYNPYCAYSKEFVCPLPPRENIMPIGILAGEKIYD